MREPAHSRGIEILNRGDVAEWIIFGHVIRIVCSEQDVIRAKHLRKRSELIRREHDRVYIDPLKVSCWRRR